MAVFDKKSAGSTIKTSQVGFTLFELLVVLTIMAFVTIDLIRWQKVENNQILARQEGANWFEVQHAVRAYVSDNPNVPVDTSAPMIITDLRALMSKDECTNASTSIADQNKYGQTSYLPCKMKNTTPLFGYKYHITIARNADDRRKATIRLLKPTSNTTTVPEFGDQLLLDGKLNPDIVATATLTAQTMSFANTTENLLTDSKFIANIDNSASNNYCTVISTTSSDADQDTFIRTDGSNTMKSALSFDANNEGKYRTIKNLSRLLTVDNCNVANPSSNCSSGGNIEHLILGDQIIENLSAAELAMLPDTYEQLFDGNDPVHGDIRTAYKNIIYDSNGVLKGFPGVTPNNSTAMAKQVLYRAMLAKHYDGNIMNSHVVIDAYTRIFNNLTVSGDIYATRYLDNDVDYNVDNYQLDPDKTTVLNNVRVDRITDLQDPTYYVDPAADNRIKELTTERILDDDDSKYRIDPNGISVMNYIGVNYICDMNNLDPNAPLVDANGNAVNILDINLTDNNVDLQVDIDSTTKDITSAKCTGYRLDPSALSVVNNLTVEGDLTVAGRLITQASKTYFADYASHAHPDEPGARASELIPSYVQKYSTSVKDGEYINYPADCPYFNTSLNPNKTTAKIILVPMRKASWVVESDDSNKPGYSDFMQRAIPLSGAGGYGRWQVEITSYVAKGYPYVTTSSQGVQTTATCQNTDGCRSRISEAKMMAMTYCNFEHL